MPSPRSGTAVWRGDLQSGAGTVSVASGLFEGQYSFKTRFEDAVGTNPEELIAAAHASCFSMALANILSQDGHAPESVHTTARVYLHMVDGAPAINRIDLTTEATVPGIDQGQFDDYAAQAKAGCPVSKALSGVDEIRLEATLKA